MALCLAVLTYHLLQYMKAPDVLPEDVLGLPTTTSIPPTPIRSGSGGIIQDDVYLNSESLEVI